MTIIALASVLALCWAGYHAIACATAPFTRCRGCGGTGRLPARYARRAPDCRRCHGTGRRLRLGRRAWNRLTREHHHGTR